MQSIFKAVDGVGKFRSHLFERNIENRTESFSLGEGNGVEAYCLEKPLASDRVTVPQTDTGSGVEYNQGDG